MACLAAAFAVQNLYGLTAAALYRDPNQVSGWPFITGWYSYLGAVCWIVSATVAFFAYALIPSGEAGRGGLVLLGAFSTVMAADDLFMLHDGLLNFLGLNSSLVMPLYAALLVAAVWASTGLGSRRETPFLVLALAGLAASIAIDIVDDFDLVEGTFFVVEDAAKFAGITFWALYVTSVSLRTASAATRDAR